MRRLEYTLILLVSADSLPTKFSSILVGAFLYHRGSLHAQNSFTVHTSQKFLNSGCIAGRAGQVRQMIAEAYHWNSFLRNDQQILVRYMLENPDIISLDYKHDIFLTTYKVGASLDHYLYLNSDLSLYYGRRNHGDTVEDDSSSIGFIHSNCKSSNGMYTALAAHLKEFHRLYYSGRDGPTLLLAVQALLDKNCTAANMYLNHDIVLQNRSSLGGNNSIGDILAANTFRLEVKNKCRTR